LKRQTKDFAKRLIFAAYRSALKAGFVIVPNHYYVENPDVNVLASTRKRWAKASAMVGIESSVEDELACLRDTCEPFIVETVGNRVYQQAVNEHLGPGFGYVEAQVLHCFLRRFKPPKVVEVGSGTSTFCSLHAIALDERRCEFTCIEPFPRDWLARDERVRLIREPVQSVPFEFFSSLGSGDLLFIDSSHAVKTGSDVNFLILEVLPRLNPGVFVHFHDISFPYDYNRDTLHSFVHPQETALLHAFLIGNRNVRVMFSLSRLHHERPDAMRSILPEYSAMPMSAGLSNPDAAGHFPSSIYLKVAAK
jgi:hypothetical protein